MKKKASFSLLILLLFALLLGCGNGDTIKDGYYTAQQAEYSHGWKEFVTITAKGGEIVAVEYNAENESGFIKSWDNAYMKNMESVDGTYPNEYTRNYAAQLLKNQSAEKIDAITGASNSHSNFEKLAVAAIEQAKKGDSSIITVKTE